MEEINDVSRETSERIVALCAMITQWNGSINLVAPATIADLSNRHVRDSAQLVKFLPPHALGWADLGSGGGFPGLIVAALLAETRPVCRVTLIESDQRKAVFLRQAVRVMGVQAHVIADRIEKVQPQNADVVSARALAPLPRLIALSAQHLAAGGTCVFPKGKNSEEELTEALQAGWSFSVERHKSETDPSSTILVLRNIVRDTNS